MSRQSDRVPGVEARAGKFAGPSLIGELHDIQQRLGWLPREELEALARHSSRPLYEIEGLVSFYPHFRTAPPKPVKLDACHDLTCWLADGETRLAELRGTYADDADVELAEVSCLGRCDQAPAAAVNDRPAPVVEVAGRVEDARAGRATASSPSARPGPARWPNDPYPDDDAHHGMLKRLLTGTLDPALVAGTLSDAGLRGMGGAGFPTGRKWELVAGEPSGPKYVVCNADESEPGTFKDREVMRTQPHLVLEGLVLGMAVVGAEQGWVFIRHEYGPEEEVLREEIARMRADGLLGEDVLGSGRRFDVEIFTSPGGYILGEETAMLECMEGHRGEPRNKPPFPGTYGLWGRPTLINSVETLAHVPVILDRGAAWWREQGVNGGAGLKFFAVSGHVERPGVYCVPMGTTVRTLLDTAGGVAGGGALAAVQPGGASSNFLGPDQLDVPLDFDPLAEAGTMLGSGALVVMGEGTDLLDAAVNVLRFFRDESCGKCVPCRVGSAKAHQMLTDARADGGALGAEGEAHITELEQVLRKTSICGLGQVALGPVTSVLKMHRAR